MDGRKKAHLVAKGFSQVEGLDFNQVFSPVMCFETVHLMLALATLENWYITGLDIQSAYLYGKLDKEIYMEQPEGFVPRQEHKVLRLWHALYGLKQASLAWWHTLNESLKELRFEHLKSEAGIFFYKKKGTNIVIGIIYVDDALFCGPNKAVVDAIKAQFMRKWECRDLGEPNEWTIHYGDTDTLAGLYTMVTLTPWLDCILWCHWYPGQTIVETHASLGAHILISIRPNSFVLLSTATHTQPARELSDAQLGTSDRALQRSCISKPRKIP